MLDVERCRGIKWVNGALDRVQRRELAAGADLELWNCGASSPDTCPVTLTPRHPHMLQTDCPGGNNVDVVLLHYT